MTPISPAFTVARHHPPSPGLRAAGGRAAVCVALLLSACASQPPAPDWQVNAQAAARKATEAYLSGHPRVAQLEWDRARAEVARTGRPDLLARLELMHCAAQVASLVLEPCERFEALRRDAAPPEHAYADYLAGRLPLHQATLLPPAQRAVAASGSAASLAGVADPLSRLVAAGVMVRTGRASPEALAIATETASAQGWQRPLMAWLLLQAQQADAAGNAASAAALRRRVDLIVQGSGLSR